MPPLSSRTARLSWSSTIMQPLAIEKVYRQAWPDAKIIEVDIGTSEAEQAMDRVHGTDKLIVTPYRSAITLAQRFRQAKIWNDGFRHFTIRKAERDRYVATVNDGGSIPALYAYGYATETLDDFIRLYIVRFAEWFSYVRSPYVLPEHKPIFKPSKNGNEPYYWIPWASIDAQRFIPFVYAQGMTDLPPLTKRSEEQPALIQLHLDLY